MLFLRGGKQKLKLCSEICDTYARRVGNEVGWSGEVTTAGIKTLTARAAPRYKMSMKLLNEQAGDAICRMRVVYLVNLFEYFMQDFIQVKDCLEKNETDIRGFWDKHLSEINGSWNLLCDSNTQPINKSTSFMNIRYSLFVLENKYEIKYPSSLTPLVPE